jgi:hypothetical protein
MRGYKLIFLILMLIFITQIYAETYDYTVNNNTDETYDTTYATIHIWVEPNGSDYKVWYELTPKVFNITYTAEIFNSSGVHPGVGNPTVSETCNTTYTYSNYWIPVAPGEFPLTVKFTILKNNPSTTTTTTKTPIPLGAAILTLIAIPLITLKMVRK